MKEQEVWTIGLDFPIRPRSRWGYGRPPHRGVEQILDHGADRYGAWYQRVVESFGELSDVPVSEDPAGIYWDNGWLSVLDALAVYTFAGRATSTYLEIGSGMSTRFARRGVARGGGAKIVSIDPEPRDAISRLCDDVIAEPLESVPLTPFDRLGEGDVVFFDGSHRCFSNSDVVVFFLEILPRLAPGVVVGVHDVYLPDDYPPEWDDRFYSEQYVLAAYLLGGHDRTEVLLPMRYCSQREELAAAASHLWDGFPDGTDHGGSSFWLRTLPG